MPADDAGDHAASSKGGSVLIVNVAHSFYGATYLFETIGDNLGVTADLKKCFPDTYKQILSTAYYLIMEDKNPLSRFPKWSATHKHPYGKNIPSQLSSELFASITEEAKIDKNFLFCGGSIGWLFLLVNGYFASVLHQKAGDGDAFG